MGPAWKIERIKSLSDEVKELHPVLRSLFAKIPGITAVEYTHGNREYGADFVLTKYDASIFAHDYVGVIVKSTSIKQNQEDVRRQIKECEYPRTADLGKKVAHLTEIWIVTSKDITKNAQDVISHEYKNTKIRFFDADKLVQLISTHNPEYWDFVNSKISTYISTQKHLIEAHGAMHSLLPIRLGHVTVDQQLQRIPEDNKRKFQTSLPKPSQLIDELTKRKSIYIEGGMGSGKSELLRSTALKLCDDKIIHELKMVPYFTTFRALTDEPVVDMQQVVSKIHEQLGNDDNVVVIFVDGLDEKQQETSEKIEAICELANKFASNDKVKIVVSSRDIKEPNLSDLIGKSFDKYTICPLTYGIVVSFIEQICNNVKVSSKFKSQLQRSQLLKALPRTPLSAILLGKLISENVQELPSTLPELYSKYTELVLGRWDLKKGSGSEKEYETVHRITCMVAAYMLDNDIEHLARGELEGIVKDYLDKRRTGQDLAALMKSFLSRQEIVSYDEDNGVIHFRHRTFQEYFYASLLFQLKGREAPVNSPFDVETHATEYFYLGLVKDAPERIAQLTAIVPSGHLSQLLKVSNMGSLLMAAYQTPYDEIKKSVYFIFLEAARLYGSVTRLDADSWLRKLPELQVLALFSGVLREAYAYDFFTPALQDAKLDAETDQGLGEEDRIVMVFLIDVILAALNDPGAFKALVERHDAALPWTVRLGISFASKESNFLNDATRWMEKRINKATRANPKLISYFKELEAKPLAERKIAVKMS